MFWSRLQEKAEPGERYEDTVRRLLAPQRIVCAWCQKTMQDGREPVSHGICPECREKHFPGV